MPQILFIHSSAFASEIRKENQGSYTRKMARILRETVRGRGVKIVERDVAAKPWGKFVLEDYNGTHEFALFSKDYENFRKYLFSDYFLFVRGRVQPKPYNDKELEFKIISMVQLSEMRDTMIKEMNVLLPVEDVTPTLVRELTEKVKEAKGETLFRISVIDREAHVSLSLFSKSHKVSLTQSLVSYLDDNEIKYSIA